MGPLTSSMLEARIEFRPTQKVMAYGVFAFLVFYLFFCGNFKGFFKKDDPNKEERSNDKEGSDY